MTHASDNCHICSGARKCWVRRNPRKVVRLRPVIAVILRSPSIWSVNALQHTWSTRTGGSTSQFKRNLLIPHNNQGSHAAHETTQLGGPHTNMDSRKASNFLPNVNNKFFTNKMEIWSWIGKSRNEILKSFSKEVYVACVLLISPQVNSDEQSPLIFLPAKSPLEPCIGRKSRRIFLNFLFDGRSREKNTHIFSVLAQLFRQCRFSLKFTFTCEIEPRVYHAIANSSYTESSVNSKSDWIGRTKSYLIEETSSSQDRLLIDLLVSRQRQWILLGCSMSLRLHMSGRQRGETGLTIEV